MRTSRRIRLAALSALAVCAAHSFSQAGQAIGSTAPSNSATTATLTGRVNLVGRPGKGSASRADIVIFVEGNDEASQNALLATSTSFGKPRISHQGMQFSPQVLVIQAGTTVDFLNDDGIFHNAFSLSRSQPFDLGIYPRGMSKTVTFNVPGLVRVYCNIHPNMVSNILVLETSHYTVTGDDGQFALNNLPDGNFTVRTWAEHADEQSHKVVVSNGSSRQLDLTMATRPRLVRHRNKFGKPYRAKY